MRRLAVLLALLAAQLALAGDAPPVDRPATVAEALDAAIESRLAAAGVAPAPDCGDSLFLRRAAYDLTGGPVDAARARAFLLDRAPDKRARLVRELARSPQAAVWWGRFLLETVTEGGRADESDEWDGRPLLGSFARSLGEGRGVDAIVRELLLAEGNRGERPQVEWLLRWEVDPARLAGSVGRDLLGVSIGCAQCHDHPHERWTQDDFWSLAAFFARTRYYEGGSEEDELSGVTEHRRARRSMAMRQEDPPAGDEAQPRGERRPQRRFTPRFLDGSAPASSEEPRAVLAARVTAHPLFARNLANRAWARLLGAGLVEPVEEAGAAGASRLDAPVLDALAARLRQGGHDLLDLVETIALTRAYARAGLGPDAAPFARHRPRPLSPDQLRTTLVVGLGLGEEEVAGSEDEDAQGGPREEEGEEAEADEDSEAEAEVDEDEMDEGEPGDDVELDPRLVPEEDDGDLPRELGPAGSKSRLLALLGGATVREAVLAGRSRLLRLHGPRVGGEHVEGAFLALVSRPPAPSELEAALEAIRAAGDGARGLEDLLWALLNSAELGSLW